VAQTHPDVVASMAEHHEEWMKTLAPWGHIPDLPNASPQIPTGHGWVISDGNLKPKIDAAAIHEPKKKGARTKKRVR